MSVRSTPVSCMGSGVEALRRFNRSYTQRIGVLDERFLGRDRTLGPSRVLWEIGVAGLPVTELRERLGLDSGYVSRLLRTLEDDELVVTSPDPNDGRRRFASLTPKGEREWEQLDRRSDELAAELLDPLTPKQQDRLQQALRTADLLIRAATLRFVVVDPRSDRAIASMTAYFDELDERFPDGFDPGDTLVADAAKLRPPEGVFVVAVSDGQAVACGGVQVLDVGIGEIKRMWVAQEWRGLGVGRRMLTELEQHSRQLDHHTVRLDTNSALTEAIAMYETAGYHAIDRYNDNPFAKRWFEKPLA